ncbi:B1 bradykinin receptor [Oenanthe melanoleuca]|uniref:B1 bradykinin receptor n=1 Tax=Oenanthe melanoleuca TaxID=2939378 RepID=UPI0024C114ED|nr:B1 bradykinin receptor [Oenanthe melanoleuca]XP_056349429.1 B1 bradykinin receptor [Oenanthe melanoleuca]XP_056349430.1 B1 bradykinin receptor [Oenanthe melanoleuca]
MTETPLLNILSSNDSENQSNSTACPELVSWWNIVYYIVPKYLNTICVIGMLGNVFVLFIYSLHKGPLKIAEIYLMNLAVADLIFLVCLPFWAENISKEFNWPFGTFLCSSISASITLNMYTSIYLLVAVSVDRYLTFVHTLNHREIWSKTMTKRICLLIWFFCILLSIPAFLFRTVKDFPQWNITACTLDFPTPWWQTAESLVLNVVGFVLPSSAITFLNFSTIRSLRATARARRALGAKGCKWHKGTKATRLIFTVVLMFLFCWTPHHFFVFLDTLFHTEVIKGCFWEELINFGEQFSFMLATTNSCINPVIYVFVGKYFRQKALEVFSQFIPCGFPLRWVSFKEMSSNFKVFPVKSSLT